MRDDVQNTIELLREKIRAKEAEALKWKKVVNDLCEEEGAPLIYPKTGMDSPATIHSIRSDQFYGETLSGAARQYLEMRKASGLGAASVGDIFDAVKAGGYKFDTKDDVNAKTGVRLALRKNSSIFHRLPNGGYGLLSWYAGMKARTNGQETARSQRGRSAKRRAAPRRPKPASSNEDANTRGDLPVEPVKSSTLEVRHLIVPHAAVAGPSP